MTAHKEARVASAGDKHFHRAESYTASLLNAIGLGAAASTITLMRRRYELTLLGVVLTDPAKLVPVAKASGITPAMFHSRDTWSLWFVAEFAAERPGTPIIPAAERLLRQARCWDDRQIAGNRWVSMRWSRPALKALIGSFYPSVAEVRALAGVLLEIDRQWDEIVGHARVLERKTDELLSFIHHKRLLIPSGREAV